MSRFLLRIAVLTITCAALMLKEPSVWGSGRIVSIGGTALQPCSLSRSAHWSSTPLQFAGSDSLPSLALWRYQADGRAFVDAGAAAPEELTEFPRLIGGAGHQDPLAEEGAPVEPGKFFPQVDNLAHHGDHRGLETASLCPFRDIGQGSLQHLLIGQYDFLPIAS